MNAAVSHISASAIQADALRAALRNPPLPGKPEAKRRDRTHVLRLLRRLRPALA
jgi:hypothetical protein